MAELSSENVVVEPDVVFDSDHDCRAPGLSIANISQPMRIHDIAESDAFLSMHQIDNQAPAMHTSTLPHIDDVPRLSDDHLIFDSCINSVVRDDHVGHFRTSLQTTVDPQSITLLDPPDMSGTSFYTVPLAQFSLNTATTDGYEGSSSSATFAELTATDIPSQMMFPSPSSPRMLESLNDQAVMLTPITQLVDVSSALSAEFYANSSMFTPPGGGGTVAVTPNAPRPPGMDHTVDNFFTVDLDVGANQELELGQDLPVLSVTSPSMSVTEYRRLANRYYMRIVRMRETPQQRDKRLRADRERARRRQQQEDEAARNARLERNNANRRERYLNEPYEKRAARLKARNARRSARYSETEECRKRHAEYCRSYQARRLQSETSEAKQIRLAKERDRVRKARANMAPDTKALLKERDRERKRLARMKKNDTNELA